MSTAPHAVQASPKDFVQYDLDQVQQFVSVPTVEHILVEQPVTFKQYKQKTSYVQVPIPQKYSKLVLNHQHQNDTTVNAQMFPPTRDYIPTVAGLDKPVYGCQAGPFQQRAWGGFADEDAGFVVPTGEGDQGGIPITDVSGGGVFSARAPLVRDYIPTVAGLDKPVYGCCGGPFQQRAWGGFVDDDAGFNQGMNMNVNQGMMGNGDLTGTAVFSPNNYFYSSGMAPPAAAMAAPGYVPRISSYAGLY
jgi:hypothetical protein